MSRPKSKKAAALNPAIRTVKNFCTSNVGADEDTPTLWIFGAGASRHLQFPLSFDLFSASILLCTEHMKRFKDSSGIGYQMFRSHYADPARPAPSFSQLQRFQTDPVVALKYHYTWNYLTPKTEHYVRIQSLYKLWVELPSELSAIGIDASPENLVGRYPEELINEIRKINIDELREEKQFYDTDSARSKVERVLEMLQEIYFLTLSHFNDRAREMIALKEIPSLYSGLVRSHIFEKNARIISFNYDTMLDEALFLEFTRTWHYGGMTIAGINGYPVSPGTPADLTYIKPHGSLNYMICPACGRAYVYWFGTYRKTGANTIASGNRRCAHCREPRPGRTELLSNMVVSPLYDKKIIERSYEAIISAFQWAEVVVGVGYSFPTQDAYFYHCLVKAVKGRAKPLVIRVVSHTHVSASEIAATIRDELEKHGLTAAHVKVEALDIEGFEQVRSGLTAVEVEP